MTFVAGTLGDDHADRITLAQARLVADLFPGARVVRDDEPLDPAAHRVVYGGPHVNAWARDAGLPFELGPGRLTLGDLTLEGDDLRVITLVPPGRRADGAPRPAFLLYAGTGAPGVAEINAVRHGPEPIVVADAFGRLVTGRWEAMPDGGVRAVLETPARRIAWREEGIASAGRVARVRFPGMVPATGDEAAMIDACMLGVVRAAERLGMVGAAPVVVYVYPDRRSKQSLTGDPGDGHAVASARAVHVVAAPPAALERLLAHEATHVLTVDTWGLAGMPLLGEGVAVWVSGQYGGTPLQDLKLPSAERPALADLLGARFRKLPERVGYTYGGHLVDAAIALVGRDAVRDHLYPATAATWPDALRLAGLDPDALARAIDERLTPRTETSP